MAVNDEFTLRVVGRYQDQNVVNTLSYEIVTQASAEQDILTAFLVLWETANKVLWLGRHIDTYSLIGLKAFAKGGEPKTPSFLSIDEAGSVVGTEFPSSICRTITLYSNSANTRRRGRVMLSGSESAQFDTLDGSVTGAEVALLNTLGASLVAGLSGGGDDARLILPSTDILPVVPIVDVQARITPSSVTSRRVRQFLIG